MNQDMALQMARDALTVGMMVCGPVLAASMIIGVVVSIFQAVTQIQEMTLTFVPKTLGVAVVVLLLGPWMLNTLTVYTAGLLASLPNFAK